MNVSLTPQLEEYVRRKVESGLYNSASEVVRESLRLLEERDRLYQVRLQELRGEVAAGIAQIESGRSVECDADSLPRVFDDIKVRARQKHKARK